jgi:putative methyltransferase (TIGR04325 family)
MLRSIQRRISKALYPINSFRGVFESFADAERAAPKFKPVGYDAAGSEHWWAFKLDRILDEDYPALFWLREALAESRSLLDVGGHIGEAFYAFERVLAYPPGFKWTVMDVPTVAEAGRKLALERGASALEFISDYGSTEGADILFAAGALQYIDSPGVADAIRSFRIRPRHLVINKTPIYEGPAFVTLQNIGTAHCPYRIFNRQEFVSELDAEGYRLVDEWTKHRPSHVRFHPEKSFEHYTGMYFKTA